MRFFSFLSSVFVVKCFGVLLYCAGIILLWFACIGLCLDDTDKTCELFLLRIFFGGEGNLL